MKTDTTAKSAYAVLSSIFEKNGLPGILRITTEFIDPKDRINLPVFPSGKNSDEKDGKKKNDRNFISWESKKRTSKDIDDSEYTFVVMSHPQTVNQFEAAILNGIRDKSFKHPDVDIEFEKAEEHVNLIEESHRLYSAYLSRSDPKDKFYVLNGDKPWQEYLDGIYSPLANMQRRTALKYSPTTILFGGMGSHFGLSKPPKLSSLVEMDIIGIADTKDTVCRRSVGSFFPRVSIGEDVEGKPAGVKKWSEAGVGVIPPDITKNNGAILLRNIRMYCDMILDRVSDLSVGDNPEENAAVKVYMIALWLATFWRGLKRGFNHYHGRNLTVGKKPCLELLYTNIGLDCDEHADNLREILLKADQKFCEELHTLALNEVVKLKLVDLTPLKLKASPELDKKVHESQSSKGKKKRDKAIAAGETEPQEGE